ncbi:MAG: AAA family ATPase [Negativicutes bacterium]|jgi:uridine kinase
MNCTEYSTLLLELGKIFCKIPQGRRLCLAIDGCGGSGKTTLADQIATLDLRVKVIHVDDLYLPSQERKNRVAAEIAVGGNYDLDKLFYEVIHPYRHGLPVRYQKYDWQTDRLGNWDEVAAGQILVVEGVYSLHCKLRDSFDFKIWVDCPRDERLRRGIERDGAGLRDFWEKEWMPLEDEYLRQMQPWKCADYIIDGACC